MTDLASCAYKLKQYNRWRRGEEDIGETGPDPKELGLLIDFAADALNAMDLFDRLQLQAVVVQCQQSQSLSDAGRQLFQASRQQRSVVNDADRLRKYLAKFGLTWEAVVNTAATMP